MAAIPAVVAAVCAQAGAKVLGIAADGEVCQALLANLAPEEAGHTRPPPQEDWDYRHAKA